MNNYLLIKKQIQIKLITLIEFCNQLKLSFRHKQLQLNLPLSCSYFEKLLVVNSVTC